MSERRPNGGRGGGVCLRLGAIKGGMLMTNSLLVSGNIAQQHSFISTYKSEMERSWGTAGEFIIIFAEKSNKEQINE